MNTSDYTLILAIIGGLTILTNLLTEVIKPITKNFLPTEITATVISLTLTLVAFLGYCDFKDITVYWYSIAAAVVLGFLTSYSAQFGFDKLQSALLSIKKGEKNN